MKLRMGADSQKLHFRTNRLACRATFKEGAMSNQITQNRRWGIDPISDNLRARGDLAEPPRQGSPCFYGRALGSFAQRDDWMADKVLVSGHPSLWYVLRNPRLWSADQYEKTLNELLADKRKGPLMVFFEWLIAKRADHGDSRLNGVLQKEDGTPRRGISRLLLKGYGLALGRAATCLGLDDVILTTYAPTQCGSDSTQSREREMFQWTSAPPHAARMLLIHMINEKSSDTRGSDLRKQYDAAELTGDLVSTPGGVRDLKLVANGLTRAMAVDCFLREHPEHLDKAFSPEYTLKKVSEPMAPPLPASKGQADLFAEKMALNIKNLDDTRRFSPAVNPMLTSSISREESAEVIKCTWDAGDPLIRLSIRIPDWYDGDLEDLTTVIYTEGLVNRQRLSDAMFAFVEDAIPNAETGRMILDVRPLFGEFSLLYKMRSHEMALGIKGVLVAPGVAAPDEPVLGISIYLGKETPQV